MLNLSGYGHGKLRCTPILGGTITWTWDGVSAKDLVDLPGSITEKRESYNAIAAEYRKRGIYMGFSVWRELKKDDAEKA